VASVAGATLQMQFFLNPFGLNSAMHVAQPTGNTFAARVSVSDVIDANPGQMFTFNPHAWSQGQPTYFYYGGTAGLGTISGNAGAAITEVYEVPGDVAVQTDLEGDIDLPIHFEPEIEHLPTEIEQIEIVEE
jgi:hypothetical protein